MTTGNSHERFPNHPVPDLLVVPELTTISLQQPCSSPTSLCVPSCSLLSPSSSGSIKGRASSIASSIFDLSWECEQLEQALKENDVNLIQKILHVHHGKFPLNLHVPFLDKTSCDSRSRRPSSRLSQDVEILLRKSQTLIDQYDCSRRESVTPDCDIPMIFRTSLHIAIQNNAIDVLKILLKYGIDPNEPTSNTLNHSRRGSHLTDRSRLNSVHETYKQPTVSLIQESEDVVFHRPTEGAGSMDRRFYPQHIFSDTARYVRAHSNVSIIRGHSIDKALKYTSDELFALPPLFLAVSEGKINAIHLLLRFGAQPDVQDRSGFTPLYLAVSEEFQNAESVSVLLRYGARIHKENNFGVAPVDLNPDLRSEQKAIIKTLMNKPVKKYENQNRVGNLDSNYQGDHLGGNMQRIFKKLNGTEARPKSKDKKNFKDTLSFMSDYSPELRERASSVGSHLRSIRYQSITIVESCDSDISLVSNSIYRTWCM